MIKKNKNFVIGAFIATAAIIAILIFKTKDDRLLISLEPIKTSYGWGYEIAVDGKTFIHQTTIPAVDGNTGFTTKEEALLVGNHAIAKLKKGRMPQITASELKEWGVIKNTSVQ